MSQTFRPFPFLTTQQLDPSPGDCHWMRGLQLFMEDNFNQLHEAVVRPTKNHELGGANCNWNNYSYRQMTLIAGSSMVKQSQRIPKISESIFSSRALYHFQVQRSTKGLLKHKGTLTRFGWPLFNDFNVILSFLIWNYAEKQLRVPSGKLT